MLAGALEPTVPDTTRQICGLIFMPLRCSQVDSKVVRGGGQGLVLLQCAGAGGEQDQEGGGPLPGFRQGALLAPLCMRHTGDMTG